MDEYTEEDYNLDNKCKSCLVGTHYDMFGDDKICTTCNCNYEGY